MNAGVSVGGTERRLYALDGDTLAGYNAVVTWATTGTMTATLRLGPEAPSGTAFRFGPLDRLGNPIGDGLAVTVSDATVKEAAGTRLASRSPLATRRGRR